MNSVSRCPWLIHDFLSSTNNEISASTRHVLMLSHLLSSILIPRFFFFLDRPYLLCHRLHSWTWKVEVPIGVLLFFWYFKNVLIFLELLFSTCIMHAHRFVCQLLLLFILHQVSISSFLLLATILRNPSFAVSFSLFFVLVMFLLYGLNNSTM